MTSADPSKLTDKQKIFVLEYLVDLNATQAAIRAGYSQKTAKEIASELMTKEHVKEAIQIHMDKRAEQVALNANTVLLELLKLAKSDLRKLFDESGSLLPVDQWPDDAAVAVAAVDVDEIFDGYGDERKHIGYTKKVKFWDKTKSLELLGKHLKLFTDRIEVEGDLSIADTMRKARERAKAK